MIFLPHAHIQCGRRYIIHRSKKCTHSTSAFNPNFSFNKFFFFVSLQQYGHGDANDIWKVSIIGGRENDSVLTVTTKLLIVHFLMNCALTSSGKQLPKWGFEQQEVSCNPNIRDGNAFWNFEDNEHSECKYHPKRKSLGCKFAPKLCANCVPLK